MINHTNYLDPKVRPSRLITKNEFGAHVITKHILDTARLHFCCKFRRSNAFVYWRMLKTQLDASTTVSFERVYATFIVCGQ